MKKDDLRKTMLFREMTDEELEEFRKFQEMMDKN